MLRANFGMGSARIIAEGIDEFVGVHWTERWLTTVPAHDHALIVMGEVTEVEADLIVMSADDVADLLEESRLAVSGESHHLVLVAILGEAEELGEGGVEETEGVREADGAADVDVVAAADAPHDAAEVAEAIDGDDGGLIERRTEEGAGEVGAVMLDEMDFGMAVGEAGGEEVGGDAGNADGVVGAGGGARPVLRAGGDAEELVGEVGTRVARDGDMVGDSAVEAGAGGEEGEAGPVFGAVEALLFEGGEEGAAAEEGGGGIAVEGVEAEDSHRVVLLERFSEDRCPASCDGLNA